MQIVKGPFNIKWGDNVLQDIETIELSSDISRDDYETVQGKTITIDGSRKASVKLTLLASDIAALSTLMPQFFVPNGGILSTGETVNHADGAIDIAAAVSCATSEIFNNLDIEACGSPAEVCRIVNARSSFEDIEFNKIRKVGITFIGQPVGSEGIMQFFKKGTITTVS